MSDAGSSSEKPTEVVAAAIENDSELNAMRTILAALVPLKREARSRVLDYVLGRLGMLYGSTSQATSDVVPSYPTASDRPRSTLELGSGRKDIRWLRNEKSPRSANEMAALVAYYLSEVAPETYRKETINANDIKTYFKQANFKLPSSAKMTLVNAKNSGYLEPTATAGQYRLNPVGFNLVVHSLPAGKVKRKPGGKRRKSVKKDSRKKQA